MKNKDAFLLISFFSVVFISVPWYFCFAQELVADEDVVQDTMTAEKKKLLVEKQKEQEAQVKIEKKIKKNEKKLKEAEKDQINLQSALKQQYVKLNHKRMVLAKTEGDVVQKQSEIEKYEGQIIQLNERYEVYRVALAGAMRQVYYANANSDVTHVVDAEASSRFLVGQTQLDALRRDVISMIATLETLRDETDSKKVSVEKAKKEKQDLLLQQKKEERAVVTTASRVRVQFDKATATVSDLNAELSQARSSLRALLGYDISTQDILEAAAFAGKQTGVRKDFILGMLVVETNLGRFTGGCTYKESRMNAHRKDIFKKITKELGYDYKEKLVSCPPSNYRGTGGAMGVAQFMSDTWWGYKSRIASASGHNPPDPWSLVDGVMAMAIKLANDGATKKSGEWNAAARYLGTCSTKNTRFYCENVLYWSRHYDERL